MKFRYRGRGKKRYFSRYRYRLRRNLYPKSRKQTKRIEMLKIIEGKTCEVCKLRQNDDDMLLCDQCDDAYHWSCAGLDQPPDMQQLWICQHCNQIQTKNKETTEKVQQQSCTKCGINFSQTLISTLRYKCEGSMKQIVINQPLFIECCICNNFYHTKCFSHRPNSINCWDCQNAIRKDGPKSHSQFLIFIQNQLNLIHEKGFFQLKGKEVSFVRQTKRANFLGLKLFEELTDWQLITRHEASLYYALKSRKITFCDQQIYNSVELMELNDSSKQIIRTLPLSKLDEEVYQLFKLKIAKGGVLPYEIKEDRMKGFYVVALTSIEKGTILIEYAGEVSNHRVTLHKKSSDCIFTLLITGSSKQDLNILSQEFGNLSRFICGVNNKDRQHMKKINTFAIRFSHQGRMKIIIVAKKNIDKGQTLYLNYNAGTFQEYPTAQFVQ